MAKYCWGDEPFTQPIMIVMMFISAIAIGIVLTFTGPAPPEDPKSGVNSLVVLTSIFLVFWYMLLGNQVGIKFTQGLPTDVAEAAKNVADRSVANTLEQMVPFLALLWMEGLFVNSRTAVILGWIYFATRFLYPIFYGFYGEFTVLIELSTQPNYIVITYFIVTVFFKCACGIDLHAKIDAVHSALMILFCIACGFGCFIAFLGLAKPTTGIIISGAKKVCGKDGEEE